jgi:Zn-finger nucleic acid-binding protein
LTTRARHDVEMDECPAGHRIWLGTGDLEKMTTRENSRWLARILGRQS